MDDVKNNQLLDTLNRIELKLDFILKKMNEKNEEMDDQEDQEDEEEQEQDLFEFLNQR